MTSTSTMRTCDSGHRYFKSSDCEVCPKCEAIRIPQSALLLKLAAPARRALERENILDLTRLSTYKKEEILALHGIGPSSIPLLEEALNAAGLKFK